MKSVKVFLICIILSLLLPVLAQANSTPVIIEEGPAFSVAPMSKTPVSVDGEYLEFDLRKYKENSAKVTASYEMTNNSDEPVKQAMLFPFVTSHNRGFVENVIITADGEPLDVQVFRLKDIPYLFDRAANYADYTKNYTDGTYSADFAMDNLIRLLNQEDYLPQNYDLNQTVRVYTIQAPQTTKEGLYQATATFQLDQEKDKLLAFNINGIGMYHDGLGEVSVSIPADSAIKKAYVVILSEDGDAIVHDGDHIIVTEKTMLAFLEDEIIQNSLREYDIEDADEFTNHVIRQLDFVLETYDVFIDIQGDVVAAYFHNPYIGAFLYTVDFPPQSSRNVTVEYEITATLDRSDTQDYTHKYLYLLQPAAGWASFGGLEISVLPNQKHPFVIESSLPLQKDEATGTYNGKFTGLPDNDFYFATYKTDQPDPPLAVGRLRYILPMLTPTYILLGAVLGVIVLLIRKANRPKGY